MQLHNTKTPPTPWKRHKITSTKGQPNIYDPPENPQLRKIPHSTTPPQHPRFPNFTHFSPPPIPTQ
jgi:hypothetical protein